MPHVFSAHQISGRRIIVAAKIVHELLIPGIPSQVYIFISSFNDRLKFGSVASGTNHLRYYGLNIVQDEDISSMVDADEMLSALETCTLTGARRRVP